MITITPVKFEAYDETNEGIFKVEMFDEAGANVTIDSCVNVASWDEISPKIREALVLMQLEGDTK